MKMNGLANILGNTGTLHGIKGPPEREEFPSEHEYRKALDAYYMSGDYLGFWKAQRTEPTR